MLYEYKNLILVYGLWSNFYYPMHQKKKVFFLLYYYIENVNDTDNKNVALPNLVIFIIIFWYILLT